MGEKKYKPEFPQLYIDLCREGGSICNFCAKVGICRTAFYKWLDEYPEFAAAVKEGKELTEQWMMQKGIEGMQGMQAGNSFNATVWAIIMRNRCNFSEHRKVKIDFASCKTTAEKAALIDTHVSEGRLSTTEAKHLSEYIASCVKIDENTEAKRRLEEVEKSLGIKK